MTPRRSERAEAQPLYREMIGEGGANTTSQTPLPNPPPQGGREQAVPAEGQLSAAPVVAPDLMVQVRALYEDSAVPVREIARRAGVSERTLYKYTRKNNWRPRYAWMPDGARPPGRPGRRRWTSAQEQQHAHATPFAPAMGAGGRFIAQNDIGKPFAQGIKALDPAGRAAASQASAEAERTARRARAEAQAELQVRRHLSVMEGVNLAVAAFKHFQRQRAESGPGPLDDRLADVHRAFVDAALRRWEWFVEHEDLGIVAVERP